MITPKATKGKTTVKSSCLFLERLNALTAPAQRPIIILPQYIEIYGAISEEEKPPNSSDFNNSPKLLPIATSTPTYIKIASIPKTSSDILTQPKLHCFVKVFFKQTTTR